MQRRWCPVVPSPTGCPLPGRQQTAERRALVCSIYLRPWVLLEQHASCTVPRLSDLDVVGRKRVRHKSKHASVRNTRQAWKNYVRVHIVSDHAKRAIHNFLLAVSARGHDVRDAEEGQEPLAEVNPLDLPHDLMSVETIHNLVEFSIGTDNESCGAGKLSRHVTATVELGRKCGVCLVYVRWPTSHRQ